MNIPKIVEIVLFSGAGGETCGTIYAGGKVIACVNHDENAIASHFANWPNCEPFTEDVRDYKVIQQLKKLVKRYRRKYPDLILALQASLECTHFSGAKGGASRERDSRTLAYSLNNYIDDLDPDYVRIENVREFLNWGPIKIKADKKKSTKKFTALKIDKKGKYVFEEIKERRKEYYIPWVNGIKLMGYDYEYKLLLACNFGSVQHRLRYFGTFSKKGLPVKWPTPTHAKNAGNELTLFNHGLKPWRACREVLDLNNTGVSIFSPGIKKKAENTLERILNGMVEHVGVGKKGYLISYYGNSKKAHSINNPIGTITTKDRYAYVEPQFIDNQYGNGRCTSINQPIGSILSTPKQNLITCEFLVNPQYVNKGRSILDPCFTLIARMDKRPPSICFPVFYGGGVKIYDTDSPMTKKVKQYMIENGISDIKMRMLTIPELLQIQGFPPDYKLIGTIADQKKFIGNAVDVHMAKALASALMEGIYEHYKLAA